MAGRKFSFGLVADVQYTDLEDGRTESRTQRYRSAPAKLREAVQCWLKRAGELSFVLNLGDTVNGNPLQPERNEAEFEEIASIFDTLSSQLPIHHAVGNHCLSVPREHLLRRLGLPHSFYAVEVAPHWRLLVLDTTEMSGHSGLPVESDAVREAREFKVAHPLSEENPQMADWNGGISSAQLRWLREELRGCADRGDAVLVAAHHQAGMGAARPTHLAWNWKDIKAALTESGVVRAYFAGHDHMGGYTTDGGVHWVTVEALLEAPVEGNAFATVHVYPDRLEIEGQGVTSRRLEF